MKLMSAVVILLVIVLVEVFLDHGCQSDVGHQLQLVVLLERWLVPQRQHLLVKRRGRRLGQLLGRCQLTFLSLGHGGGGLGAFVLLLQEVLGYLLRSDLELLALHVVLKADHALVLQPFDLAHLIIEQPDIVTDLDDAREPVIEGVDGLHHDPDALRVLADVPRLLAYVEVSVLKRACHPKSSKYAQSKVVNQ